MKAQHFISISGGKDSTAVACLAVERMQRRDFGNMPPRFLFADTGNEHPLTLEYVSYLGDRLGIQIETVRADFSQKFAARRERMRVDWAKELRRKQHTADCKALCEDLAYAERAMVRGECDCPVKVSPALPADLIEKAVSLMVPTGNPFLDMGMLHGRFPGSQSRFCTSELKLDPIDAIKNPLRLDGIRVVTWIGERADESAARAKKPAIERRYCSFRAPEVLYRPIHGWKVEEVFALAKRHGLKPNPLYLQGMSRVGCMPCIMCQKGELREIARRFPDQIERIAEWERIAGGVARHAYTHLLQGRTTALTTSFLPTDKLPDPGNGDLRRSTIHNAVEWSKSGRGGRQYDLISAIDDVLVQDAPSLCSSKYGLCE